MRRLRGAAAERLAGASPFAGNRVRAQPATAQRRLEKRRRRLGLSHGLSLASHAREFTLHPAADALAEERQLDGCHVRRPDLTAPQASQETVHDRYQSRADVTPAFRRSQTVELERRPVPVRTAASTRGQLLVVMFASLLMKELGRRWAPLDRTVAAGRDRLNTDCAVEMAGVVPVLLQPRADVLELLTAARMTLPPQLPGTRTRVATGKTAQTPSHPHEIRADGAFRRRRKRELPLQESPAA